MSEKRPRPAPDDAAAWDAVARSVKPLPRRARPVPEPLGPAPAAPAPPRKAQARPKPATLPQPQPLEPVVRRSRQAALPPIEDRVLKAIRRGQTPIDLRLDLHGQTQTRAHALLERMLAAGRARGARVVLVVTGTGLRRRLDEGRSAAPDDAPGVLRRMLPHWLGSPPVSGWVIGLSQAAPHHGGAGAFYILLRRERPTL